MTPTTGNANLDAAIKATDAINRVLDLGPTVLTAATDYYFDLHLDADTAGDANYYANLARAAEALRNASIYYAARVN